MIMANGESWSIYVLVPASCRLTARRTLPSFVTAVYRTVSCLGCDFTKTGLAQISGAPSESVFYAGEFVLTVTANQTRKPS
ncbi:hypothetical protein ALC60_07670 [Trachymyrmex zeteki]|uniref:Uncharacterized protein n=1 Tax=Mycetomoellerius zeteki TaxID=64791 RepID=A0A151WYI1_9HYME|nr:hypothetical protein ALC60_07670 [Trachymyrmex zeteki]